MAASSSIDPIAAPPAANTRDRKNEPRGDRKRPAGAPRASDSEQKPFAEEEADYAQGKRKGLIVDVEV
jgi:hypothetical protein